MKVVRFHGREDKLALSWETLSNYMSGSVLDVGCDEKYLAAFVKNYVGVGIGGNPDLIVNVEDGLPFKDKSFDTTVAFDVLEHLDDIHYGFDELCRVAKRYIIVGLPNMYEWRFRLMFLLGKRLSGKYGLPTNAPVDRHRWVFSLTEAQSFIRHRGLHNGCEVRQEIIGYYKYRRTAASVTTALGRSLGHLGANLFAYNYWAVLERSPVSDGSEA
ncbi:methionine biosynthesis protein MetW [Candidatus Methylomirabilis sp.]|uniref:Class I SAM-dependent methyltransferase n=1 Tax=Candidatus Methylomirabilis tolerans TaxID=3123416 RepID=A0AAJ1AL40_9BACT|nr:class I SAM-dependent methyltransferase [Candidatus Methylomirabilis sp.]